MHHDLVFVDQTLRCQLRNDAAAVEDGDVNHYNTVKGLGLTKAEKQDLVGYLKSL